MKTIEAVRAWGRVLAGRYPTLSIEITRECPLRCPGCYAYEDAHLGNGINLRQLRDLKGDALIEGVLALARRYRPLHLSIVGGDPLVRFREVDALLPKLNRMGIFVQLVTSAFRPIPLTWRQLSRLNLVVSIDGLAPEHDARRSPATYERILRNIAGHQVIIHCTVTGQMMKRPGYLQEFLNFWSPRSEIRKVWMSLFTPQKGDESPECLTSAERGSVVEDLMNLRERFPKLDMGTSTIREFLVPPKSPAECIFARTTLNFSADLTTRIAPCQFGGDPDCSRCGCLASMALAAVGRYQLPVGMSVGEVFEVSARIGQWVSKLRVLDSRSNKRRADGIGRYSEPEH
jgi:sulfatase maturation enzyme AslB (radical SAM superfamily)